MFDQMLGSSQDALEFPATSTAVPPHKTPPPPSNEDEAHGGPISMADAVARAESCGAEIKVVRIGLAPHLHLNRKAFLLQTHKHGNLRSASYESLFSPSIPSCAPVSHSSRSCGAFQVTREENQRVILPMTQPLQVWHLSALPSGRTRASKGCTRPVLFL